MVTFLVTIEYICVIVTTIELVMFLVSIVFFCIRRVPLERTFKLLFFITGISLAFLFVFDFIIVSVDQD